MKDITDSLPDYPDFATYPNNRQAHQLRRFKNGQGLCSCERWMLDGASEKSLVRSHQYHVTNNQPT